MQLLNFLIQQMHDTRNSSPPGVNSENMYAVSRGYHNDATTFEVKESLQRTVKASASILDTGHLGKTQTIVTGEIQHVNGNKLSISCMEQLSKFFRSWQS